MIATIKNTFKNLWKKNTNDCIWCSDPTKEQQTWHTLYQQALKEIAVLRQQLLVMSEKKIESGYQPVYEKPESKKKKKIKPKKK